MRFAEIIPESRSTPFWTALKQLGVTEVVGVLPRHLSDWRGAVVDQP